MKRLQTPKVRVSIVEKHTYICDLINIEGPLLSLYRDQRRNWLYLWADTDGVSQRWLVFEASRGNLIDYLNKQANLRNLVEASPTLLCLEATPKDLRSDVAGNGEPLEERDPVANERRYMRQLFVVALDNVKDYLPSCDSYFDETLTEDISLAAELQPTPYAVPIDGDWFFSDLDKFSRTYAGLYAFFYCTGPRFVTNVGARLYRYLRSPWEGGFSRINLFDGLVKSIPSLHDMQVKRIQYASPGFIQIEALASVGKDIAEAVDRLVKHRPEVDKAVKSINTVLTTFKIRKANLSNASDDNLSIGQEHVKALARSIAEIASLLGAEKQLELVVAHSPNKVVASKATMALVNQLSRLADYQELGMLDLKRPAQQVHSIPN